MIPAFIVNNPVVQAVGTPEPTDAASAAPAGESTLATDMGWYMGYSAGAAIISTVGQFFVAHFAAEVQKTSLRMQESNIEHQGRLAESAANFEKKRQDDKAAILNQTSQDGNGPKGLKEINTIVNKNKLELAKAQGDLAQTKAAIKEAKQTAKAEKLDTRKLDAFFDPRDPRLHYSTGNPVRAA